MSGKAIHPKLYKPIQIIKKSYLRNSICTRLADFSYSLYLIHRILLLVVFAFFFEKEKADMSLTCLLQYAAIVSGIMLITYVIYYFTERKTGEVKRWIKLKLQID